MSHTNEVLDSAARVMLDAGLRVTYDREGKPAGVERAGYRRKRKMGAPEVETVFGRMAEMQDADDTAARQRMDEENRHYQAVDGHSA